MKFEIGKYYLWLKITIYGESSIWKFMVVSEDKYNYQVNLIDSINFEKIEIHKNNSISMCHEITEEVFLEGLDNSHPLKIIHRKNRIKKLLDLC